VEKDELGEGTGQNTNEGKEKEKAAFDWREGSGLASPFIFTFKAT